MSACSLLAEICAWAKDFFLNKVHIIHYRVPKDVDLNHYFEVMNSRGEQLEKHEIVKAKLSEQLIGDEDAMEKFSRIWEACSDTCCPCRNTFSATSFPINFPAVPCL